MKPIDKFLENAKRLNVNIDSVVWQEKGNLEEREVNIIDLHELRSCGKVLIAMAYGIAIDEKFELSGGGYLSLDTKVISTFEKLTSVKIDSRVNDWTIKALLTYSTGYEEFLLKSKEVSKLNADKLFDFIFNTPLKYLPNTHLTYSNVEPYLLSVFFQENFDKSIDEFINERIFKPLGIKKYEWNKFGEYCAGATGLYLNYKDFHKIGQLLLSLGEFDGRQIVPKVWMEEMTKVQAECPDYYKPERLLPKLGAGYFTWISKNNIVFRDGSNGQYIICDYKNNKLVTIMSTQKEMNLVTECLRGLI